MATPRTKRRKEQAIDPAPEPFRDEPDEDDEARTEDVREDS